MFVEEKFNKIFDQSKPQWKFYLIENYRENQSAIIIKIHHSYTDGIGLSSMFLNVFECESE